MGSIPVRVMNKIPDLKIRDFFMQPVRGIERTRPPAGGKKEPGGLFFSVRVPTNRNVYRGCCNARGIFLTRTGIEQHDPAQQGKQQPSGLLLSATGCGSQRLLHALRGVRILLAAAPTTPPCFCRRQRSSLLQIPICRNVYRGCCIARGIFCLTRAGIATATTASPNPPLRTA